MIIKKIFDNKCDEEVHSDFLKFGKGEFKKKYLTNAKRQGDKVIIKTGPEFVNYLVRKGLEKASGKLSITGVIVSTMPLEVPFSKGIKQFMGIKQHQISGEIDPKEVLALMSKYPRVFFALSFILPDYELKVKPKAPKSAKPSTNTEKEVKPEFCTLKTTDENFVKEMFFDCPHFKEVTVGHTLKITGMLYPKDFANMKPELVREQSKRQGVIVREVICDGKTTSSHANFEA